MSRVKRSVHARKKRRATLDRTKGYRGQAKSSYKRAKEALLKADSYSYAHRRTRKRDFRRLWIVRINAAARLRASATRSSCTACARRAWSSTARCWRTWPFATPRPSDVLPRSPGRRWRPDAEAEPQSHSPGRPARRPFSFQTPKPHRDHLPPQRAAQDDPQAPRAPLARAARPVRRRGRGPGGRRRGGRLGARGAAPRRDRRGARAARRGEHAGIGHAA